MGLSNDLLETNMSLPCVRCARGIIHLGKWFKAVAHVECPFCGMTMVWGYQMKLRLFQRYEAAQASAQHLIHRFDDLCATIGLGIKYGTIRNIRDLYATMPGDDDDTDWRPSVCYRRSEHETIHSARHVNISNDDSNIAAALQNFDCRGRIGRLDHDKSLNLEIVDQRHADERLVFHNEDGNWG